MLYLSPSTLLLTPVSSQRFQSLPAVPTPFHAVSMADRVEFGSVGFLRNFATEINPWLAQAERGITEYIETQQTTDPETKQLIQQRPRTISVDSLGPVGSWEEQSAGLVIDIMFWVLSKLQPAKNIAQAEKMLYRAFTLTQQKFLGYKAMDFPRFDPDMGMPRIQSTSVIGKWIFIAPNGAIEVILNDRRVIFEKAGANGQTVAQYRITASESPNSRLQRLMRFLRRS